MISIASLPSDPSESGLPDQERRIVFLINSSFPYQTGGRETWLYNIAERLAAKGRQVSVLFLWPKKNQKTCKFQLSPNIALKQAKTSHQFPLFAWMMRSYGNLLGMLYYARTLRRELVSLVGKHDDMTVVCLDTVPAAAAAVAFRRSHPNTKLVISCRGLAAMELSRRYPLVRTILYRLERQSFQWADEIWANGKDTARYIESLGYEAIVIGNGADVSGIQSRSAAKRNLRPHSPFRILSVATLRIIKGIDKLLEATALLARLTDQPFEVWLVGKGDPSPFQRLAAKLGIIDIVNFLGERTDVPELLAGADLTVCLSKGGGMSMATLEALAAEIPIVAWDTDVYRQMIRHDETGVLVPDGDTKKLAEAIHEGMCNYERSRQMAAMGLEYVRQFDWESITRAVITRIDKLEGARSSYDE